VVSLALALHNLSHMRISRALDTWPLPDPRKMPRNFFLAFHAWLSTAGDLCGRRLAAFAAAEITAGDAGFNVLTTNQYSVFSLPDKSMIDMRVAAAVKMWIGAVPCLFLFAFLGRLRKLMTSALGCWPHLHAHFRRVHIRDLRPRAWLGISVFSLGLGGRPILAVAP